MSDHTRVHVWEQEKARAAACLLRWAEISTHVSGSVPMSLRLRITGVQVWPLKTAGCEPRHGRRKHSTHLLLKKGCHTEMGLQVGHEAVHTVHLLWSSQISNYFPDLLIFLLQCLVRGISDHFSTPSHNSTYSQRQWKATGWPQSKKTTTDSCIEVFRELLKDFNRLLLFSCPPSYKV